MQKGAVRQELEIFRFFTLRLETWIDYWPCTSGADRPDSAKKMELSAILINFQGFFRWGGTSCPLFGLGCLHLSPSRVAKWFFLLYMPNILIYTAEYFVTQDIGHIWSLVGNRGSHKQRILSSKWNNVPYGSLGYNDYHANHSYSSECPSKFCSSILRLYMQMDQWHLRKWLIKI